MLRNFVTKKKNESGDEENHHKIRLYQIVLMHLDISLLYIEHCTYRWRQGVCWNIRQPGGSGRARLIISADTQAADASSRGRRLRFHVSLSPGGENQRAKEVFSRRNRRIWLPPLRGTGFFLLPAGRLPYGASLSLSWTTTCTFVFHLSSAINDIRRTRTLALGGCRVRA